MMSGGIDEVPVSIEPAENATQGLRGQAVAILAMRAARGDQLGGSQLEQMLRDGGLRDREGRGQFFDGALRLGEEIEDGAAGGVGDGAIDVVGGRR